MDEKNRTNRLALSEQQCRILAFLRQEAASKGFSPSLREIGNAIGLTSSSTVLNHLRELERKGHIRRSPTKPRAIQILDVDHGRCDQPVAAIPLVGQVAAGRPIPGRCDSEDYVPFPRTFLHGDSSEYFFLTASGDSMIEAGIRAGDLLLVRRQEAARNGQIVVVMLEGESTVKYFYSDRGRVRLQPANRFMDPIWLDHGHIVGEVVSLLRPSVV